MTLRTKKKYIYDMANNYKEVIAFNPRNYLNDPVKEEDFMAAAVSSMFNLANSATTIHSVHFDSDLKIIMYSARNNLYFYNILTNDVIFYA